MPRGTLGVVRPVLLLALTVGLVIVAGWFKWRQAVLPMPADFAPFSALGQAAAIEDGDTLEFERMDGAVAGGAVSRVPRRFTVRLHGVDAPERLQSGGAAARAALMQLTRARDLQLDCYKRDSRGRAVCRVRVRDAAADGAPSDIELELLQQGWAWHYLAYASEQTPDERARYAAAEAEARSARRGLWRAEAPMPPWECRERLRSASACD